MQINKSQKISALIITLNEELRIKSLIEDLDFVNEIIVIDSFSTDRTVAIAQSFDNVQVICNKFINYTSQRNFALDQAKYEWVFFIDVDEQLTSNLKTEIISSVNCQNPANAYLIYRTFMFKDLKLRFSGWQTDKIFRLYNKSKCRYSEERFVHEKLKIDGTISVLKNKLIHYSYTNYDDYKMKMNRYGVLKANEKFKKGQKPSNLMLILHPTYTFLYRFLIRLGFLDGTKGIIICYLNAYSVYIRYKELNKITFSRI
jgi:glycosyltransferase involved in cell wall biosynthesis